MPPAPPEELPHRARVVPFRFENVGIINVILLPVRITIWVGVWVFALIATLAYSYLRSIPGADAPIPSRDEGVVLHPVTKRRI